MSDKIEIIENQGELFPGGGYYYDNDLQSPMPCKPEQGQPSKQQGEVMQKIDIIAQELQCLAKNLGSLQSYEDLDDLIDELNGQTITLLQLFCMESEAIDRGNDDDKKEEGRGERREGAKQERQTSSADQKPQG